MPTFILSVSGARGIVGDGLDDLVAARLARAFAAVVGAGPVLIGRDSRPSGPRFARAAAAGLVAGGCSVADLGIVATPTVQVAVEAAPVSGGLVITASHNPIEWNALKFVGPTGAFLPGPEMARLREQFEASGDGAGDPASRIAGGAERAVQAVGTSPSTTAGAQAVARHVAMICKVVDVKRIRAAGLKVVVDAVHGAGSVLIEPLLEKLGVTVEWIAREPNGELPEHPEPRAERLAPLVDRVREVGADVGFALDPDGDRCALVTAEGILGEEWTLPLAALSLLRRGVRGPLVANLSTSARMEHIAATYDVPFLRAPVGEANVVGRMREAKAIFGGEGNGGVIDPAVHLGRDAGVAIARLLDLEVGAATGAEALRGGIRAAAAEMPPLEMVKRKFAVPPEKRAQLMERLRTELGDPTNDEDGLRWSWPEGWLHVRASGTEPVIRAMAEAASAEEAGRLIERAEDLARDLGIEV